GWGPGSGPGFGPGWGPGFGPGFGSGPGTGTGSGSGGFSSGETISPCPRIRSFTIHPKPMMIVSIVPTATRVGRVVGCGLGAAAGRPAVDNRSRPDSTGPNGLRFGR